MNEFSEQHRTGPKLNPPACECEGYPGIAHDMETLRVEVEKRRAQLAALFGSGLDTGEFIADVARELLRARKKFPNSWGSMTALTEEVGELAKAMLDESPERVYAEAVQVACMACRVAIDGDSTLAELRRRSGGPEAMVCRECGGNGQAKWGPSDGPVPCKACRGKGRSA